MKIKFWKFIRRNCLKGSLFSLYVWGPTLSGTHTIITLYFVIAPFSVLKAVLFKCTDSSLAWLQREVCSQNLPAGLTKIGWELDLSPRATLACCVRHSHRPIFVNSNVRFNPETSLILSYGFEKLNKCDRRRPLAFLAPTVILIFSMGGFSLKIVSKWQKLRT